MTRAKDLLLVGTALLAFIAAGPAAHAQRINFAYTGNPVSYTIPKTGLYHIVAYGAQGGTASAFSLYGCGFVSGSGGGGAEIGGDFVLTAGEILNIAVGGAGTTGGAAGGGGGSFVVGPDNMPLVIAGGGGGGGYYFGTTGNCSGVTGYQGGGGLTGPDGGGTGGVITNGGKGGNGGGAGGGLFAGDGGGGGGGFLTPGGSSGNSGTGGGAFPTLTGGSIGGGFGGGGGAGFRGSGGGGGYSGGGGGFTGGHEGAGRGFGGGSFDGGSSQTLVANLQTGNGEVIVSVIFAGTPRTPNCHGGVVSDLAKRYGGLVTAASALGYSSVQLLQNDITTFCAG